MNKLLQGEALEKRAIELGVDIHGFPKNRSTSGSTGKADNNELQRRVLDAERHNREQRLWLIAVISAVASVVSAITALVAVMAK